MSQPEISLETFRRINRAKINLDLCFDELSTVSKFAALCNMDPDIVSRLTDKLYLCQERVRSIGFRLEAARALQVRIHGPLPQRSEPRRVTRIVPYSLDEMNDGSVNETLAPDHPYFRDTPLVYVHGGPSTCILCKETHPCGCRPPTPAERAPFQSPPPDAQAIPESPLVMTQSDYDRYQREIADEKCHCGVTDWMTNPCSSCVLNGAPVIRSNAPSPESEIQMSDSMKALLDDSVMKK